MPSSSRAHRVATALIIAVLIGSGTLAGSAAAAAAPTPPAKMAALGDSISIGLMSCSSLTCPANSWSTGTTVSVASHASRLKASIAPALVTYNNAVSGAASAALPAQAQKAVAQGAQYVTIEIGANDACTKTVATMTPTATFTANVQSSITALSAGAAKPEIFVASIPNIQRMYELNKSNASARLTWGVLGVCQSLLANPTSTKAVDVQRRAAVQQRVNEYNAALATICTSALKCRYDGGAVAGYQFVKADISTRDYFHPSLTGQSKMAAITWVKTQWVS